MPEDSISATEQLSGNLYSLLGRVDDAIFHALMAVRINYSIGEIPTATAVVAAALLIWWKMGARCCAADALLRVYPRVSPCVIVLVNKGDKMLLAAAAGFQKRFYSTLAGFMEPGETCEAAVIREVREEVGIEVGNVRYFASQPWPFPSQVMLGFFAEWQSGELMPNPDEIEDADWFDVDAMPPTPPNASISGQLISDFIERR